MPNLNLRRLFNIKPQFVSLVDKAANKRQFLIMKRDEGGTSMEDLEVLKNIEKALNDIEAITSRELYDFFKAFLEGVMERGKAKIGEKTIIDVLFYIVEELEKNRDASIEVSLTEGYKAAQYGLEKTKNMMAQHGKAAVFREKTLGLQDQGGTACLYIMQGFKEAVLNQE